MEIKSCSRMVLAIKGLEFNMQIKRNGSEPSGRGPVEWFTGRVKEDVAFVEKSNTAINDQIDAAYRAKYHRYAASIINSAIISDARSATLKLVPNE